MIAVDRSLATPLYRQIYDAYREAIVDRRLRAGQRLPSTRGLASALGISRIPALGAFEQLLAEGYFEARRGAGTFVARSLPDDFSTAEAAEAGRPSRTAPAKAKGRTRKRALARRPDALLRRAPEPWLAGFGAFRMSQPAIDAFPLEIWSRLVSRHSRNPRQNLFRYSDAMGALPCREAIAEYLRTARAVRCEADQVMVVSGSQQALEISARVLLEPGSPVWVEDPGYRGARDVLTMAGAKLVPVRVDAEGLDVRQGIARSPRAHAAHVTPSHQYPIGVTLSASRRLQLLDWAHRSGAWILEDDYDSEFRFESLPIASLQGLDRDARVIYIGTFSKVLFPALRMGYVVIPSDLRQRFSVVREAMDICAPALYQAVLADFLSEGHFARHLRRMRLLYGERRSALVEALDEHLGDAIEVLGDAAGLHLVVAFKPEMNDRKLANEAAQRGLWTMPLSPSYAGRAGRRPGLVLGYGSTSLAQIRDGVAALAAVLTASR